MTKYLKTKWIKALRSKKYNQIQSRLKDKDGYCCMGVLCEVSSEIPFKEIFNSTIGAYGILGEYGGAITQKYLNLIDLKYEIQTKAIKLNDNGKSFNEIADYLQGAINVQGK